MRGPKNITHGIALACVVLLTLLLLSGCQSADKPPASAAANPSAASPSQPDAETLDLTAGLSALSSYQVSYAKSVQGTLDGQPYETSTKITRSLVSAQPGEESTVNSLGADGSRVYLHYVRLGDEHYFQSAPDQACKGGLDDAPIGQIGNPAALLPRVIAPQPAGSEAVNGIEATRYPLDSTALGLAPEKGTVSGSLWIAEQGGYLVKYSLQFEPPAAATGKGLEANQSIEYEISQVNEIAQIELPSSCIPVLMDIPAMPDASEVDRRSALMSYYTTSGQPEIAAFYARELPPLGWLADELAEDDPEAGLSYSKDGSLLKILLDSTEEGLMVSLMLSDPAYLTPLPPGDLGDFEMPDEGAGLGADSPPEPTVDPTQLGLPPDVPLYPGARNVQSMSGMGASFVTSGTVDQVVQFYTENLTQAGWQNSPMPGQEGMMIWLKGETMLNLTVRSMDDGDTLVSIMAVNA